MDDKKERIQWRNLNFSCCKKTEKLKLFKLLQKKSQQVKMTKILMINNLIREQVITLLNFIKREKRKYNPSQDLIGKKKETCDF
jgi:hypothetical protein